MNFVPQPERPTDTAAAPGTMNIQVFRNRSGLDRSLRGLMRTLLVWFSLVTAAVVGAVILIVRSSLTPLRQVSERVAQIDAAQLHLRVPGQSLPTELAPIQARLNELLERLEQAFARERRFTSDVAHELRTPIAELRSITEVALRWPGDTKAATDALLESHDIARQMQTLVTTLLALVRSDRIPQPDLSPISLSDAIERVLPARSHAGQIEVRVPSDAVILAEPALLASVLRNVLDNAMEYCDAAQPVICESAMQSDRCVLMIQNKTSRLTAQDVEHVFEPFWRKDDARSDAKHSGLGLALVRSYCALMKAQVQATLIDGTFILKISFPREVNHAQDKLRTDLVGSSAGCDDGVARR